MVGEGSYTFHPESDWGQGSMVRLTRLTFSGNAIELMEGNGEGRGSPTAQGPAPDPAAIVIFDHAEHLVGGVIAAAELDEGTWLDRHGIRSRDGSAGGDGRKLDKSKPKLKAA